MMFDRFAFDSLFIQTLDRNIPKVIDLDIEFILKGIKQTWLSDNLWSFLDTFDGLALMNSGSQVGYNFGSGQFIHKVEQRILN